MTDDAAILVAKVSGSAVLGSALALRFIPGSWWQRLLSFLGSLAVGCLVGGFAMERFELIPGSYAHMCAVAISAIFGLSIVNNGMQQIPEVLTALRKRTLGS